MEDKLRCPSCSSSQTRFRIKSKTHVCFVCGHVWEKDSKDNKEGDIIDG